MRFFILLFFFCLTTLSAEEMESDGVKVDLYSPTYEDGVLSTNQGGVVTGSDIRIQAKEITYTNRGDRWEVQAKGDLVVRYKGKHFVGDRLEYNFETQSGVIKEGRTQVGCWFIGGKKIELKSKGSYGLKGMYLSTCEGQSNLWQIKLGQGSIQEHDLLTARNVQFRLFSVPIFWLPYFRAKLSSIQNIIAKYQFITGGTVGDRISMRYQIYSWKNTQVYLQGDYWFTRGPSTSLQFDFDPKDSISHFKMLNFIAFDYHRSHPYGIFRNRFVGEFKSKLFDCLEVQGEYDKLSDSNVLETYFNRNYFLYIERRTKLEMRLPTDYWIGFLRTEVRVNEFDIVSQELPLFNFNLKPLRLSPFIGDFSLNVGYLDFVYGNILTNSPENFRSPRIEIYPKVYIPLSIGALKVTPKAEYIGIGYGQSIKGNPLWNSLGHLQATMHVNASRFFGPNLKHVIEPYTQYDYYSRPTVSFKDHFLFNFYDSYVKLNQLRWGIKNFLYYKPGSELFTPLALDVYTYGFFNNQTIGSFIPKIYIDASTRLSDLYVELKSAYNAQHDVIDYSNIRAEYTFNENFAFSVSFLHRSRYHYRKANHHSYFLDVFRTQADILASPVSNRRNILLSKFFVRPHKRVHFEFKSRTGWNQVGLPYFNELFFTVTFLLPCNWKFHATPRRTVSEGWRWDFRIELGETPPEKKEDPYIYW